MLNHFLRYLHINEQYDGHNMNDWLTNFDQTLTGFPWRGGADLNTTGILMWSHPFVVKIKNDQKIAVVLMDTQGTFDSKHSIRDSATVFALSTMISSIQGENIHVYRFANSYFLYF